MSAIHRVLDRLDKVKQSAPGRWMARCPAHEDSGPSLSIRETDDGRVLVYCFAGCGAGDVLAAVNLKMADLFDRPIEQHLPPVRGGFSARELLELNSHEATVAAMLSTKSASHGLTEQELQRLRQAAARLGKASALHGN